MYREQNADFYFTENYIIFLNIKYAYVGMEIQKA